MNLTLSWFARFIARRSGPKLGAAAPDADKTIGLEGTQAITMQPPHRTERTVSPD